MFSFLAVVLSSSLFPTADAQTHRSFDQIISRVEGMVWDADAQQTVSRQGLDLVNVTWEDTGRSKGSVWGPNISDMTIGVRDAHGALHPMPVIRHDNFNDVTADIRSDRFMMLVGNESGDDLRSVRLDELLQHTGQYLHNPSSWRGGNRSLWDARDEHVLVSAQACFLPVPSGDQATFTPVLYNYQSYPGDPAVLTIVATREGSSIQVIENSGGYMSQPLFFNDDGQRAPFLAERKSDWVANGQSGTATTAPEAAVQQGMHNVVLVIQVPLKQRHPRRNPIVMESEAEFDDMEGAPSYGAPQARGMEEAVISHGETEGPFVEVNNLNIERDTRFPIRVTVQFYQATDTGDITDADVRRLREQIDRVYRDADFVGSLVTDGWTGRPTEWQGTPAHGQAQWAFPGWGWLVTD